MTGAKLKRLPSTVTSWEKWRNEYPQTQVLSLKTGYVRDYSSDPYEDYYQSKRGLFSFLKPGPGAGAKELVIGVELDGKTNAYRLDMLREKQEITDVTHGRSIKLRYDIKTDTVTVKDETGMTIDYMATYWMVWKGIYPETELFGN
jgi:hypothetical protein